VSGGDRYAGAQSRGTARLGGPWQQPFQEIQKRVQPVHYLRRIRMARQKVHPGSQGIFQNAIVEIPELCVAGGFPKVPPGHGRFQLVTTG